MADRGIDYTGRALVKNFKLLRKRKRIAGRVNQSDDPYYDTCTPRSLIKRMITSGCTRISARKQFLIIHARTHSSSRRLFVCRRHGSRRGKKWSIIQIGLTQKPWCFNKAPVLIINISRILARDFERSLRKHLYIVAI